MVYIKIKNVLKKSFKKKKKFKIQFYLTFTTFKNLLLYKYQKAMYI